MLRMVEHLQKHRLRRDGAPRGKGGRPASPWRGIIKRLLGEDPRMDRKTMAKRINQELGKQVATAKRVTKLLSVMKGDPV